MSNLELESDLEFIIKQSQIEDRMDLDSFYLSLEKELENVFGLNYGCTYIKEVTTKKQLKNKLKRNSFNKLQKYSLEKPNLNYYSFNYQKTLDQISRENMLNESKKRTRIFHAKRNK